MSSKVSGNGDKSDESSQSNSANSRKSSSENSQDESKSSSSEKSIPSDKGGERNSSSLNHKQDENKEELKDFEKSQENDDVMQAPEDQNTLEARNSDSSKILQSESIMHPKTDAEPVLESTQTWSKDRVNKQNQLDEEPEETITFCKALNLETNIEWAESKIEPKDVPQSYSTYKSKEYQNLNDGNWTYFPTLIISNTDHPLCPFYKQIPVINSNACDGK